jgi:hypothetical protein
MCESETCVTTQAIYSQSQSENHSRMNMQGTRCNLLIGLGSVYKPIEMFDRSLPHFR